MISLKPLSQPKPYLQGWVEFYKLKFKVTPDVLIPRPETELLVDEVLKNSPSIVLDIGTGSGNIAISIAKNSKAKVFATDISSKALEIAKENAKKNKVEKKIFFIESDLLSNVHPGGVNVIIVANLPYIPTSRIPILDPSVADFEPELALDGGKDGFDLYRKLFAQIRLHLRGVKLIICEIDETQGELALKETRKYFPKAKIEVKKDLAKKPRILVVNFGKHQVL